MEFHAYPSLLQGNKTGSFRMFWRTQGLLHSSDSVILPAALLIMAIGSAMYQHMADKYDTTIRNFLVMIILSMLPLAFLEKKLLACVDPLGLLCKFSTKVLMMHACFHILRVLNSLIVDGDTNIFFSKIFFTLAVACILLPTIFGFRFSRSCIWEHRDVWLNVTVACVLAVATELFLAEVMSSPRWKSTWYRTRILRLIFMSASDYTEILTFVPAIWMVCRADQNATVKEVDVTGAQKRALALFAFMIIFYFSEDVLSAYELWGQSKLAAFGHLAHFLLLLDFAAFILAHLYDPDKYAKLMDKFYKLITDHAMV